MALVVLSGLTGCDDQPEREPAAGDLVVSATVAASEFGVGMAFSEDPPAGSAPEARQDCQGAYEWARGRGALQEGSVPLQITYKASHYTQVDGLSLVVRVMDRSEFPGFSSRFSCDAGSYPEYDDPKVLRVELPVAEPEAEVVNLPLENPLTLFSLGPGEEFSFVLVVTLPKNAETTLFEVVLRADVNGVERTYVLRDGDRPFALMSYLGGAGFSPSHYYWCPGSPGRLVHQPSDGELPLEPPC